MKTTKLLLLSRRIKKKFYQCGFYLTGNSAGPISAEITIPGLQYRYEYADENGVVLDSGASDADGHIHLNGDWQNNDILGSTSGYLTLTAEEDFGNFDAQVSVNGLGYILQGEGTAGRSTISINGKTLNLAGTHFTSVDEMLLLLPEASADNQPLITGYTWSQKDLTVLHSKNWRTQLD
ncbi:MAG: hypothetical protein ACI30B_07555 [Paludibacteraceae bacterium]